MPGRTTAAHGAFRSGRTFPQRFPLRNGIFTHIPELPGQSGNGEIFSALLFRGAEAGRLPRPLNNGRLAISVAAASSCGGHPLGGEAVQGGIC